jgi:hypothetical protein
VRRRGCLLLIVLALIASACSSTHFTTGSTGPPPATATTTAPAAAGGGMCGRSAQPPAHWQHVVWIWMENHTRSQVIGKAPFVTGLAAQCATATHYATVGSPSLPNYLGATSGSTFGIGDDGAPGSHRQTADNLFRQVRVAGGTALTYAEAMPAACALSSSGRYAVKHNPAAYYAGADDRVACQRDNRPLPAGAIGELPTFLFVVPDLCDDTHDCPVATGDRWLAGFVPSLLSAPDTVVFIVWDEYTPMPNVVIAPSIRPGTIVTTPVDHYSLLRTTEELLGLPLLGHALGAPSMRQALNV